MDCKKKIIETEWNENRWKKAQIDLFQCIVAANLSWHTATISALRWQWRKYYKINCASRETAVLVFLYFFFVYSFVPVCCNVIQIVFYFQNGWEAAAAVHNIINIKLTITLASIYSCLWYFVRFFFFLFFVTPHNRASLFFLMWFFQTERNKNVYCSLKSLTGIDIFIAFFDYMGVCVFFASFMFSFSVLHNARSSIQLTLLFSFRWWWWWWWW